MKIFILILWLWMNESAHYRCVRADVPQGRMLSPRPRFHRFIKKKYQNLRRQKTSLHGHQICCYANEALFTPAPFCLCFKTSLKHKRTRERERGRWLYTKKACKCLLMWRASTCAARLFKLNTRCLSFLKPHVGRYTFRNTFIWTRKTNSHFYKLKMNVK